MLDLYDQSNGEDTTERQSRMVPSQNNWVESRLKLILCFLAPIIHELGL